MHTLSYDLNDIKQLIVHFNGDCKGAAIWTITENNYRIVDVEEDIAVVEKDALDSLESSVNYVIIKDQIFPVKAISFILKDIICRRIMYDMEDVIYDFNIKQLISIEAFLNNIKKKK